ncbi:Zinc finger, PHD-type domain and Zinc finger, FYVE/PHD-type domain and Zinc finger, RING/FYVE/PHD-type domain and Zinc finger, PHD-finger domain-containing protein [Strongyloides ratti]|uniref:Inhibitor of growth protein n=1 Tax=Strongyloides ratti TaxID=34506 RepID=A0A090L1N6_STRRB|nr:Zinc finger, PHD-type domain and Zinc finger, FYVE/PHD-type domain and Zinc finger, RING/FYVE/PHD-type domain and Zinc finger, PHD-finger domain-containing protein [Strongyloides ratti]CEF63612.1 Zinc finger, PHD-type domain and Zinc finger, FYVE/PHD-type domain and Zinc finger, RING/FYVE/PHD-type domain and Zinc finger, PHD-finger domain-containing protein [Strongyloides ratti]
MLQDSLSGSFYHAKTALGENLKKIRHLDDEWCQLHKIYDEQFSEYTNIVLNGGNPNEEKILFDKCLSLVERIKLISEEKRKLAREASDNINSHLETVNDICRVISDKIREASAADTSIKRKGLSKKGDKRKEVVIKEELEVNEVLNKDTVVAMENEPIYCICREVAYGSMIQCDNDKCPIQWFHLECVKVTEIPKDDELWFCDKCSAKKSTKRKN